MIEIDQGEAGYRRLAEKGPDAFLPTLVTSPAGVAGIGGNVAGGNHPSGGDGHEVDELRRVRVPRTAKPRHPAAEGAGVALCIGDFEPALARER